METKIIPWVKIIRYPTWCWIVCRFECEYQAFKVGRKHGVEAVFCCRTHILSNSYGRVPLWKTPNLSSIATVAEQKSSVLENYKILLEQ